MVVHTVPNDFTPIVKRIDTRRNVKKKKHVRVKGERGGGKVKGEKKPQLTVTEGKEKDEAGEEGEEAEEISFHFSDENSLGEEMKGVKNNCRGIIPGRQITKYQFLRRVYLFFPYSNTFLSLFVQIFPINRFL